MSLCVHVVGAWGGLVLKWSIQNSVSVSMCLCLLPTEIWCGEMQLDFWCGCVWYDDEYACKLFRPKWMSVAGTSCAQLDFWPKTL